MARFINMAQQSSQRAGRAWQTLRAQPSWVTKAAAIAFVLVIGIPLAILLLVALVVATMVFALLWAVNRVLNLLGGALPRRDGRQNVRVIQTRHDRPGP